MAKVRAATTEFGVGVGKDEGVKVVKETASYLRLEYTNAASGAVDDVEFFIPGARACVLRACALGFVSLPWCTLQIQRTHPSHHRRRVARPRELHFEASWSHHSL